MKHKYWNLPKELRTILQISDGWLVGSSPIVLTKELDGTPIRDYDIAVSDPESFQNVVLHLERYKHEINSKGGLKFILPDFKVDIWLQNIERFIRVADSMDYIYHFNTQTLIQRK